MISTIHLLLSILTLALAIKNIHAAEWMQFQRLSDTAYFLFDFPSRIERYDTKTSTWLDPIHLSINLPSAFQVDDAHLIVAYERQVYRYDISSNGSVDVNAGVHVINLEQEVTDILTDGDLVFLVQSGGDVTLVSRSQNLVLDTSSFGRYSSRSVQGVSISPWDHRLLGISRPSDLYYLQYNSSSGALGSIGDSPYHGDYRGGVQTWIFPNGGKVVDSSGNVYAIDSLTHLGAFPSQVTDIDWHQDVIPVVLESGTSTGTPWYEGGSTTAASSTLTAHSKSMLPTGTYEFGDQQEVDPKNILVGDTDVFVFAPSSSSVDETIQVLVVPLDSLNPPDPAAPLDPRGAAFEPGYVFVDQRDKIHLFSKEHQSIFQWDPATQRYNITGSIGLVGVPSYMTYSKESDTIYTAYDSGLIRRLSLNNGIPSEEVPLISLPSSPRGLTSLGSDYLFSIDDSGAWETHYSISILEGTIVDSKDWNHDSKEFVWSDANQKLYFIRSGSSPTDLHSEEINVDGTTYPDMAPGEIGEEKDSSLHSSSGFKNPVRVKPDGSVVLLGSGLFHDAATLDRLTYSLGNEIVDAVFLESGLMTFRDVEGAGVAQFQQWEEPTLALGKGVQVPGKALRLLATSDNRLVGIVMSKNDIPTFYVVDKDLNIQFPEELETPFGLQAQVESSNVALTWVDISGEDGYTIERREGQESDWVEIGTTQMSVTSYADGYVDPSIGDYSYRVVATNPSTRSSPSEAVQIRFGPPATPTEFSATALSTSSIMLEWDVSERAESYSIERSSMSTSGFNPITSLFDTSYTDNYLSASSTYYYRIIATNSFGDSEPSFIANATTFRNELARAPRLYSAHPLRSESGPFVALRWFVLEGAEHFELERSDDGLSWMLLEALLGNQTNFDDYNVNYNSTYYYRIRGLNAISESEWSFVVRATTVLRPPLAPRLNVTYYSESGIIHLAWDFPPSSLSDRPIAERYTVKRYKSNESELAVAGSHTYRREAWQWLADLAGSLTSFSDDAVSDGSSYSYQVTLRTTDEQFASSNLANVTTMSPDDAEPSFCHWECVCESSEDQETNALEPKLGGAPCQERANIFDHHQSCESRGSKLVSTVPPEEDMRTLPPEEQTERTTAPNGTSDWEATTSNATNATEEVDVEGEAVENPSSGRRTTNCHRMQLVPLCVLLWVCFVTM